MLCTGKETDVWLPTESFRESPCQAHALVTAARSSRQMLSSPLALTVALSSFRLASGLGIAWKCDGSNSHDRQLSGSIAACSGISDDVLW